MEEQDANRQAAAEAKFKNRQDLIQAIQSDLPTYVVPVETPEGVGTGFFYTPEWLVSNSHVLTTPASVTNSSIGGGDALRPVDPEHTYVRPQLDTAPDIAIVKRKQSMGGALPPNFSEGQDGFLGGANPQRIFFYISRSPLDAGNEIVFLDRLEHSSDLLLFQHLSDEGVEAQMNEGEQNSASAIHNFGASGAPIIEARILVGRVPTWTFKIIGILYASCDRDWYDGPDSERLGSTVKEIACGIPLAPDFEAIRRAMICWDKAKTAHVYLETLKSFDHANLKWIAELKMKEQKAHECAEEILKAYEAGRSRLNLPVPAGLKKLVLSDAQYQAIRQRIRNNNASGKERDQWNALSRAKRERIDDLQRNQDMQKTAYLNLLRAQVQNRMNSELFNPFSNGFKAKHVYDENEASGSYKNIAASVADNRSFGVEEGSKKSSTVRMSAGEGERELYRAVCALRPEDLEEVESSGPEDDKPIFQIRFGKQFETNGSYRMQETPVEFNSGGNRLPQEYVNNKPEHHTARFKFGIAIAANGKVEVNHFVSKIEEESVVVP